MPRIVDRLGFAAAGALAIVLVAVLGGLVDAGPLDPSGSPQSTDSVRLPGTPISSLPFPITQPGHYYLTRDLSITTQSGITVNASDVSIDLGGFTLSSNDPVSARGITAGFNLSRITVTNGTVRDWNIGIDLTNATDSRVSNVAVSSNFNGLVMGAGGVVTDCIASGNTNFGIWLQGTYSEVRRCSVTQNTIRGISVIGPTGLVERNLVSTNNTANSSSGAGIVIDSSRVTVRDNELINNGLRDVVIFEDDSVVMDNAISCPAWLAQTINSTNNYLPVNNSEPHTNRAHRTAC